VVGIIAVLTAIVGASIWRAHELAVRRDLAIEAEQDPENSAWEAALSVRYEKVGDLLLAQGDLNRARTQFRRLLEIQHNLARRNPGDLAWQRSLLAQFVSHL
jgi:hypothetical protein